MEEPEERDLTVTPVSFDREGTTVNMPQAPTALAGTVRVDAPKVDAPSVAKVAVPTVRINPFYEEASSSSRV